MTATPSSVRTDLAEISQKHDNREEYGLLNADFPKATSRKASESENTQGEQRGNDEDDSLIINGDKLLGAEDMLDDEELEELNEVIAGKASTTKPEIASILSTVDKAIPQTPLRSDKSESLPTPKEPLVDLHQRRNLSNRRRTL